MVQYYGLWRRYDGSNYIFNWGQLNLIYDNLLIFLAYMRFPPFLYYVVVAFLYFGGILYACIKIFKTENYSSYLTYLAAFSTFSYSVNGLKAGLAATCFLIAISYYDKKYINILWLIISLGIHHAMVLPILGFLIAKYFSRPKWYYYFWIICFFISALHIKYFQYLFAKFTDTRGSAYLLSEDISWTYNPGFRFDFILYSAMPILMGWYVKYKLSYENHFYDIITCTYLFVNSIWMLCMYAAFNNRIAYLSWMIYPFVLIYPFVSHDWDYKLKYKLFGYIALLHLSFTLFMKIIYYSSRNSL
jgi:hypothetical protein